MKVEGFKNILILLFAILYNSISNILAQDAVDWRNIENGISVIPDEGYCDQPYVVINSRNEWVVVMTTGKGKEGELGQHIVAVISKDRGKTWSSLIDIEPSSGPEASWVTPLLVPGGRIYVFYTYNFENRREVLSSAGVPIRRVDTLGKMMMKYSDNGGYTWSQERYEVPVRSFEIDENNIYGGKVRFFWSVAKPVIHDSLVFFPLSKVGNFGEGFMESGAGAILKSDNILFETNPDRIRWETLPDGNKGLLPPEGKVADEHNVVVLSDGSLCCFYRTNQGRNVQTYSWDNGHTWSAPEWARYTPGGKLMKQPRCFNKISRFSNGKYLLFFHNNGSRNYGDYPPGNRNPAWVAGGIEKNGIIHWNQPEVLLYDSEFLNGISYPDWIEDNGEYYLTETQKSVARIHRIPADFLEMIWAQEENCSLTTCGLVFDLKNAGKDSGNEISLPSLGNLYKGDGFSLEFRFKAPGKNKSMVLLNTRREKTEGVGPAAKYAGSGMKVSVLKDGILEFVMNDGRSSLNWSTEQGNIISGKINHIVVGVDGKAKLVTFVINGDLWDGGEMPFGFNRFTSFLGNVNGKDRISFPSRPDIKITDFRIYNRCIYVSEALGNFRYGK